MAEAVTLAQVAVYAAELLDDPKAATSAVAAVAAALKSLHVPPAPLPVEVVPETVPRQPEAKETPPEAYTSAWDPEPVESMMEGTRARALLLELIRRAAHDWVLYRTSRRMEQREIAESAYTWLFEEGPGHPWWEERKREKRQITAFLVLCEQLEIDPDYVRENVKQMTPDGIKKAGRPAEHRHRRGIPEPEYYVEHGVELVSLDDLETYE